MGAILSTSILSASSVGGGVTSALAGKYSSENNAKVSNIMSGVSVSINALLLILCIYIVISGYRKNIHKAYIIAFVLIMCALISSLALNIVALIKNRDPKTIGESFKYSFASSAIQMSIFALSVLMIVVMI